MKHFSIISLILAMSFILASCGGNPKNEVTGDNTSTSNPNNDSITTSDAPSTDSTNSTDSEINSFLKTITAETATAKGTCGPNLVWYYQDNVLVIKGTGEMTNYPSGTKTKAPWGVDSEDEIYKKVNWVIVDEGVTTIGEKAFLGCEQLSKVIFPSTLETIEGLAFDECSELRELTFSGDTPKDFEYFTNSFPYEVATNLTINYSSSSFDEYIKENSDKNKVDWINWVKQ